MSSLDAMNPPVRRALFDSRSMPLTFRPVIRVEQGARWPEGVDDGSIRVLVDKEVDQFAGALSAVLRSLERIGGRGRFSELVGSSGLRPEEVLSAIRVLLDNRQMRIDRSSDDNGPVVEYVLLSRHLRT